MPFPKVSVVIPVYNRAAVIGRAVKSVLAQTYQLFEVIVVDDGSNDADLVETVLSELDDTRVSLIRFPRNRGGSAARNIGAESGDGELVAFLDSDDEWLPDKLAKQVSLFARLQATGQPLLLSCRVNARTVNGNDQIWPRYLKAAGSSVGDYLFVRGGFLQTSSFLMNRADFLKVRFDDYCSRHQDFGLLLRLEAAGFRIEVLDDVLVVLHWEDQHIRHRGFSPEVTLEFFRKYQGGWSCRARSSFLYEHLIRRLWLDGRGAAARHYCDLKEFSFRDLVFRHKIDYLSWRVFGDSRLLVAIAGVKNALVP